jgi:outer membrane protein assembly factor BamB
MFEQVVAFELNTGEIQWTAQWEGANKVPGYASANGSWIKSTPAVTENASVVLAMRDDVVCSEPSTGEKRWQVDLAERFGTRRPPFGGVCSPLIDDEAVYLMGGGATVKLALADGRTLWRTLADEGDEDDALSSPVIATLATTRQRVVRTRTRLCGVGLNDGRVLWSEPIQAYRNMNILTPLVIGNRVFTAARSGRSQCFEIGRDDGQWTVNEVWNQKVQGYMSSPVSDGKTVYLHSNSERQTALDARSGTILWTGPPMGRYQSLVRHDDLILSLNSRRVLLAVEPSRDRLKIVDRAKVADDSWAYLGICEGGLLVRDLIFLRVYRY